jgi:hypothetical protein
MICNQWVGGSSPSAGTNKINGLLASQLRIAIPGVTPGVTDAHARSSIGLPGPSLSERGCQLHTSLERPRAVSSLRAIFNTHFGCGLRIGGRLELHRLHGWRRAGTAHDRLFDASVPRVTARPVRSSYSPSHEVRCLMQMKGGSDEPVV